jgi:hypothetical protein
MPWPNLDRGLGRWGALRWDERRCALCLQWRHGQVTGASLPRVTRHGGSGSNPKKEAGSLRLLPEAKTCLGTAPWRLTATASLLQAWMMASGGSSAPPTSRSSSKAFPWSPRAPPRFNCFGRWRIELVRWLYLCVRVWSSQDKIHRTRAAIYRAFSMDS